VPAEPFDVVRLTSSRRTSAPLEDVFEWFDTTALAAASIAQVHAATLRTARTSSSRSSAPSVAETGPQGPAGHGVARPAPRRPHPGRALANPPALVELFAETIVEELDFRLEAQNMLDVAAVLRELGQRGYVVPARTPSWSPAGCS
jgi:ubiquinone biosynthesis protein